MVTFEVPDGTVVELTEEAWDDFRHERRTAFGLLYGGMLAVKQGRFEAFAEHEQVLRREWEGRPIYDDDAAAALREVDLHRSFTLDDPDDAMAEFLHTTGFLHMRGVYSMDEIEGLRREVEARKADVRPDDGRSWWARTRAGEQVCCRLIYLAQQSPALGAVSEDARLARLAALSGETLRPADDRIDGLSVVIKNGDVVEGLSDLPWHQDCGMGGHPVLCPGLNIGIQLDEANAANGQLHFLAGSHHHSVGQVVRTGWPTVAIDTQPGDVTVHFGHVTHAAPPPSSPDAGRRAMYVTFVRDELFDVIPAGQGYNDVVLQTPGQLSPTDLGAVTLP